MPSFFIVRKKPMGSVYVKVLSSTIPLLRSICALFNSYFYFSYYILRSITCMKYIIPYVARPSSVS